MKTIAFLLAFVASVAFAAPAPDAQEAIPPLFTFDHGRIGVNFLGYRASAGLGGLLTGNAADGGLHAEAGTPFGQAAAAGLGGTVDGNGRAAGGLYAGATAGNGISAGAGLAGKATEQGSIGGSYAGSSGTQVTKVKTPYLAGSLGASAGVPVQSESNELIKNSAVVPGTIKVVEKVKYHRPHHHHHLRKHYTIFQTAPVASTQGQSSVTVTKNVSPQFINDIFNIPISTLGAVSKLVGGIAGGTVSKTAYTF